MYSSAVDDVEQSGQTYDSRYDVAVNVDDDTTVADYLLPRLVYDDATFSSDKDAYDGDRADDYYRVGDTVDTALPAPLAGTRRADSLGKHDDHDEEERHDSAAAAPMLNEADDASNVADKYESNTEENDDMLHEDEMDAEERNDEEGEDDDAQGPFALLQMSEYEDEEDAGKARKDGGEDDEKRLAVIVDEEDSDVDVEAHFAARVSRNEPNVTVLSNDDEEAHSQARSPHRTTRRPKHRAGAAVLADLPTTQSSSVAGYTTAFSFNRVKDLMRVDSSLTGDRSIEGEGRGGGEHHKSTGGGSTIISSNAARAMTEAVALLLNDLAQCASHEAVRRRRRTVQYDDVARVVQLHDCFSFLSDVLPMSTLPPVVNTPHTRTRQSARLPSTAMSANTRDSRQHASSHVRDNHSADDETQKNNKARRAEPTKSYETVTLEQVSENARAVGPQPIDATSPCVSSKNESRGGGHAKGYNSHRAPVDDIESRQRGLQQTTLDFTV